jgi:UDP-N-acetylmuramoyl-L-alanyl-D-glutamate--2,6-diaminopimelate ligase
LPAEIAYHTDGVEFKVEDNNFKLQLFGKFNVYNCLSAIAVARSQEIDWEICRQSLEKITVMPGRMEFIENNRGLKLIVDYAPEPESLRQLLETIKLHQLQGTGKMIHVFGSCGGGRDVARRPILGELSAGSADICIVTNEDPYDDDPQGIIDQVAEGAIKAGKILNQDLFKISERKEAIKLASSNWLKPGDLLIFTGKGSEQAICLANNRKSLGMNGKLLENYCNNSLLQS